jgi:hypothetical protein
MLGLRVMLAGGPKDGFDISRPCETVLLWPKAELGGSGNAIGFTGPEGGADLGSDVVSCVEGTRVEEEELANTQLPFLSAT